MADILCQMIILRKLPLYTRHLFVFLLLGITPYLQANPQAETELSLIDPPMVTARSWAIGDASTGEVLWEHAANERREIASITKVMTAIVALEAESDSLAQIVTISAAADQTGGTTAGLEKFTRLTVNELLYGMLLPSGNDAAVALAEHFGRRMPQGELPAGFPKPGQQDSEHRFLAKMNIRARELGLTDTQFVDVHGMGSNKSTARDLLKLAGHAMSNPEFRRYVNQAEHVPLLINRSYPELWRTTNKLLHYDAIDGIKTGSTFSAGGCFLLSGVYKGDAIYVVVLAAASDETRFSDAYNLMTWALKRRADEAKSR